MYAVTAWRCMAVLRELPRTTITSMQAKVFLEAAVKSRPCSPRLRLALCGLESLFGNPAAAQAHVAALSLRQVQLDTLAHHVLPALASHGPPQQAVVFFNSVRSA